MKKKLCDQKGMTLVETLSALLIIVITFSMLSQMVVQTSKIVEKSRHIQKTNQQEVVNFWKGDTTGKETENRILEFGSFQIPVRLDAYECGDSQGVLYEFSKQP